ncbi:hypothetical protein [Dapis sp. BLCC M172]|uniref:hypothetical protein n=1 Tax=Dapis sp. BLCC M172 TaxID=2975281 RepID=UPI003CF2668C
MINWNFWFFSRSITAKTKDIKKVYLETDVYGENTTYITFDLLKAQHQQKYQFGYMLSQKERKWLFAEIRDFLQ